MAAGAARGDLSCARNGRMCAVRIVVAKDFREIDRGHCFPVTIAALAGEVTRDDGVSRIGAVLHPADARVIFVPDQSRNGLDALEERQECGLATSPEVEVGSLVGRRQPRIWAQLGIAGRE